MRFFLLALVVALARFAMADTPQSCPEVQRLVAANGLAVSSVVRAQNLVAAGDRFEKPLNFRIRFPNLGKCVSSRGGYGETIDLGDDVVVSGNGYEVPATLSGYIAIDNNITSILPYLRPGPAFVASNLKMYVETVDKVLGSLGFTNFVWDRDREPATFVYFTMYTYGYTAPIIPYTSTPARESSYRIGKARYNGSTYRISAGAFSITY